jgi:hypothetical protein
MGLGLEFHVRLKNKTAIAAFLAQATAEAKARKWKMRRRPKASLAIALSPHAKSEDVDFDFSQGPSTEGYVKTTFAPIEVHIAIVEFLDALKPLCSSLKVDDETGYAKKRDRKALEAAFAEFDDAFQQSFDKSSPDARAQDKPTKFFTALTIKADGTVEISDHLRKHMPPNELKKLMSQIARAR